MPPVGPCDSVTDVSPSGANPGGPWSYGWSSSLGSAFSRYTQFFPATSTSNGYRLDAWTSGSQAFLQNPAGSLPAAFFNASATVVQLSTLTAQGGQFLLHPGPVGEYSIARWTAASSGAYEVQATFQGIDSGPTTTDAHVQHNGQDVAPAGYINVNGGGTRSRSRSSAIRCGRGRDRLRTRQRRQWVHQRFDGPRCEGLLSEVRSTGAKRMAQDPIEAIVGLARCAPAWK